jgi:hypothetical protein
MDGGTLACHSERILLAYTPSFGGSGQQDFARMTEKE